MPEDEEDKDEDEKPESESASMSDCFRNCWDPIAANLYRFRINKARYTRKVARKNRKRHSLSPIRGIVALMISVASTSALSRLFNLVWMT